MLRSLRIIIGGGHSGALPSNDGEVVVQLEKPVPCDPPQIALRGPRRGQNMFQTEERGHLYVDENGFVRFEASA